VVQGGPFYEQVVQGGSPLIDIGCAKYHFTNNQYEDMTKRVLLGCKAKKGIDISLHTGKFYVYEEKFTHHMYSKEIPGRFGAVVSKYDPYGIFAPQRWRSLFTDNCIAILPPVDSTEHQEFCTSTPTNQLPSIPSPLTMPFYYSSPSNFGAYYSVPLERTSTTLSACFWFGTCNY
jgi:hypothetical protein